MVKPKVLVLTGYGINCDRETGYAFNLAGAETKRVHINDIIEGHEKLNDYQILAVPGGFSYGDDIASGKVLANKLQSNFGNEVQEFIQDESGLTAVEYAIAGGLVVGGMIGAFNTLGNNATLKIECLASAVNGNSTDCT